MADDVRAGDELLATADNVVPPDRLAAAATRDVDVDAITPDAVWRDTDEVLYRVDDRAPDVIFEEGFQPWDPGFTDLASYVQGNRHSAFVGASRRQDFHLTWPSGKYVYVIRAPGGIDVNASGYAATVYGREQEIAFPGGIGRHFIEGAYRIADDGVSLVEWTPNPHFFPG